jgi:hypothetical protein
MSTISEVEEIIEDLKESESRDVCDVFCMEEGSELRDAVINTFIESINSNSEPKVEELVLLLKQNGIDASEIDENVEVLEDDFPRSILFYASEKDDPDVDTIKLLKKHGFAFKYKLATSHPADSVELIQKAKENLKLCCPTRRSKSKKRRTTGSKRSKNKSKNKSKKRVIMG